MPCSALVASFWRAPGERHGAHCHATSQSGATLGIDADTRNPRATASERPDTMGGLCALPGMHWISARRACGGACAPLRHRLSNTYFLLAASNVQCFVRRCAVKLLFRHRPCHACMHLGHTILPCVLSGATACAFNFSPSLQSLRERKSERALERKREKEREGVWERDWCLLVLV